MSYPPLPEDEPWAEVGVEPTIQLQAAVSEEPTIPSSPRKRKGKEVVSKALKKAKPSASLRTGGTLKVGGGGENPPPVAEEGGKNPQPAAEGDQRPQASPRPAPNIRSD